MAIDIKKRIVFPIIVFTISTLIALSIAEISLRILKIGYGNAPEESHPIFHHVHPAEYRFLSHNPTGEYGGHEIYYDADRLVANPSETNTKNTSSTCRVAFLGDSFTEAAQVTYNDSFVGLTEHNTNCSIKNYGVSSYSPIFYLLQWRQIVKEFKPTIVIVQLYSNDVSADEAYMAMAKKDVNGDAVAVPGPEGSWITSQLRKSYLMRLLRKVQLQLLWIYENREKDKYIVAGMVEENPDITKLSASLIKTLAREVEASGAQFILTVVPSKFKIVNSIWDSQTPQFSDKWRLFSQENNIRFLDLTKSFEAEAKNGAQLFFNSDIHFTVNGHRIVASELSKQFPNIIQKHQDSLEEPNKIGR
ncbi:MAG: SGNH/GDSL hydrolase family protein [Methylococcaceae bacterium]